MDYLEKLTTGYTYVHKM